MHKGALPTVMMVLFFGIIMIGSFSMSSSFALLPENLPDVSQAPNKVQVIEGDNIIAYARPLYTSLDDPSSHEVPSSDSHDGVAKLILTRSDGTFGCSGTLTTDNLHVITAAHCVADNNGNFILSSGSATFEGNSESIKISIDPINSFSHPDYDGDFIKGNDIAVLRLGSPAPDQVPGIPHAKSENSVSFLGDKTGYGLSGFFDSGADGSTYPFGTKRDGQNKYDDFADTMYLALGLTPNTDFVPQAIYQYDSDDGTSLHDAFGFFFDNNDLGLGNAEVISAPGDSGGPTIRNGELVGVTSYGITLEFTAGPPPRTSDCTTSGFSPVLDSSCGEFAGDTRVSKYSDFIDSVLDASGGSNNSPPVANDDSTTTDEDTSVNILVLANDSDDDGDSLTISSVTQGTNGAVATDGTIVTYTPNANFNGQDTFTYTISDGNGGIDSATVTVTVEAVNDAPVANDDSATTTKDTSVIIDVLSNDSDVDEDLLSVSAVTQGSNGSVVNNGADITYTPNLGFTGTDTFDYTASDGNGGTDTATVTVTVNEQSAELSMHVHDISFDKEIKGKSGKANLYIIVTIEDSNHSDGVEGATVQLTLSGTDGTNASGSGTTDVNGVITFKYNQAIVGETYTATVDSVSKDGWTYDSAFNEETSDSEII